MTWTTWYDQQWIQSPSTLAVHHVGHVINCDNEYCRVPVKSSWTAPRGRTTFPTQEVPLNKTVFKPNICNFDTFQFFHGDPNIQPTNSDTDIIWETLLHLQRIVIKSPKVSSCWTIFTSWLVLETGNGIILAGNGIISPTSWPPIRKNCFAKDFH